MPILVKHEQDYGSSISAWSAITKIIQIVLRSRLGPDYACNKHHLDDDSPCCFTLTMDGLQRLSKKNGSVTIAINILTRMPVVVLERWVIHLDPVHVESGRNGGGDEPTAADTTDVILLLQTVYSHTRLMQLHGLLSRRALDKADLCFALALSHSQGSCFSDDSSHCHAEFEDNSTLKAHNFQPAMLESGARISLQALYKHKSDSPEDLVGHLEKQLHIDPGLPPPPAHPLSPTETAPTPAHLRYCPMPVPSMRRLSRLSLSAMEQDDCAQDTPNNSLPPAVPIPTPRMQYTHHHGHSGLRSVAYSTSPSTSIRNASSPSFSALRPLQHTYLKGTGSTNDWPLPALHQRRGSHGHADHYGSLVGSYEESLLSGRMSTMPSKPIMFQAQVGVLGYGNCKPSLKCPPHLTVTFPACFYSLANDDLPTPYVGTVDLQSTAYRLPPKGQLQIVIKNPNKTAVKLFLIPYDFSDMPRNTKTFLRQKSYTVPDDKGAASHRQTLRYAIQVQVWRSEKKRIYLHKHMRLVFANRVADLREKLKVQCEGPTEPVYVPLSQADLDLCNGLK